MDYLIYNLTAPHLQQQADSTLLSADEQEIATRRGERYILTRCLLRRELARRLGQPPQDIRFHYSEKGKPGCEGIHFNLSHSGDLLTLAFDSLPIGIDIERLRQRPRLETLARRIMCPAQFRAFLERGCPMEEFYACWCAAEALVKQAGDSIWQAGSYPCIWEHGRIRTFAEDDNAPAPAQVHLFAPAPGYMGALATAAR